MTRLEPQMSRGMVGQPSMLEVIDMVLGELDACKLEESLPADAVDPFTDALELTCVARPYCDDVLHRLNHLGPPWWVVFNEGDRQLGEPGSTARVRHLASNPYRNAVIERIVQRHRRANRVAVCAVHALLFHDLDGRITVNGGGADGACGT